MPKVIVLDGNQRSALSVTRALGKRGHRILTADSSAHCLASRSRYSETHLVYPSPGRSPDAFSAWLRSTAGAHSGAVLLPMTDVTTPLCLKDRAALGTLVLPFPSHEAYETISDKLSLHQACLAHGIDVPVTAQIDPSMDVQALAAGLTYPVVIKARWSADKSTGTTIKWPVAYASGPEDLCARAARGFAAGVSALLVQEQVSGEGRGVFGLYDRGRRVASFAHRRVREKPPSGGVSVASQSVAADPDMLAVMDTLLEPHAWTGVAMAEFKVTPGGRKCLIEINARFWGSLQLAVDCGVDFPSLLVDLATGAPLREAPSYEVGRTLRWYLGEIDHAYLRSKDPTLPVLDKIGLFARAVTPWARNSGLETFRASDPLPFLEELKQYFLGAN